MKKFIFVSTLSLTFAVLTSANTELPTCAYNSLKSEPVYSLTETNQNQRIVNGYIYNTNIGKYVFFKKAAVTTDYYGVHVVVDGLNQVFNAVRTSNNRDFNYCVWVNLGAYGGYWLYFNL